MCPSILTRSLGHAISGYIFWTKIQRQNTSYFTQLKRYMNLWKNPQKTNQSKNKPAQNHRTCQNKLGSQFYDLRLLSLSMKWNFQKRSEGKKREGGSKKERISKSAAAPPDLGKLEFQIKKGQGFITYRVTYKNVEILQQRQMNWFYSVMICNPIQEVFTWNKLKRFKHLLWVKHDNSKCDCLTYQVNTMSIRVLNCRLVLVLTLLLILSPLEPDTYMILKLLNSDT